MRRKTLATVATLVIQGCGLSQASPSEAAAPGAPFPVAATCIVRGTELQRVEFEYDARTGDTLIAGVPLSEAYPTGSPPYARGAEWFARQEPLVFRNRRYIPYAPPRMIAPELLEHVGEYRGVLLFAEKGTGGNAEVVYVPVRPGCEFQEYVQQAPY